MAAPSTKAVPDDEVKEVEDDYESDEFEVEDDEGDEYQDDEDGEEEDEEVPQGNGKVSLLPVNKLHVPGALAVFISLTGFCSFRMIIGRWTSRV